MEQRRTARRAASHGTLHSSYSSQTRLPPPPFGPLRAPDQQQRRTLKSVNENAGFLASPGPLQSMLKTTTETGDIGIFSIGHVPAARAFHQLPRARTGISETNRPRQRSDSRGSEPPPVLRDDRRRLPSYRDTTSEILSMYGSEGQTSARSSLSRRFDDAALRSYSMTSSGSRQPPANYRPYPAALHSHFDVGLQRPRSPYPYPTRLKRPGVRPSSPALTEDGSVDYSRMVGIDRVSYRTVHGSYKSIYPFHPRRPPPLSLRSDNNQSLRSPPAFGTYPPGQAGAPEYRGDYQFATPPPPPLPPGPRGRRDRATSASSAQSPRTLSLTSIIDKYGHSPRTLRRARLAGSSGSFYYDYTEEFENGQEQAVVVRPLSPLAPIPTRGRSVHRPMVLDDDFDGRLEEAQAPAKSDVSEPGHGGTRSGSASSRGAGPAARLAAAADADADANADPREYTGVLLDYVNQGHLPPRKLRATPARAAREANTSRPAQSSISQSQEAFLSATVPESARDSSKSIGNDALLFSEQLSAASKSPERRVQIQSPRKNTVRSIRASILGTEDEQNTSSPGASTIVGNDDGTHACDDATTGSGREGAGDPISAVAGDEELTTGGLESQTQRRGKKFYSLEPGLSDLASLVKSLDRADEYLVSDETSLSGAVSQAKAGERGTAHGTARNDKDSASYGGGVDTSGSPWSAGSGPEAEEQDGDSRESAASTGLFRRHRRNHAMLRINTFETNTEDKMAHDRSGTPMLAPKPVSPAKDLWVKKSIPQLMKALPPLPAAETANQRLHSPGLPVAPPSSRFDVPTRNYSPVNSSPLSRQTSTTPKNEPVTMDLEAHLEQLSDSVHSQQHKSPKFRIRAKDSTLDSVRTSESRPWNKDNNYPWMTEHSPDIRLAPLSGDSPPSTRGSKKPLRLRLKVSRKALRSDSSESVATVKRSPAVARFSDVSEFAQQGPRDLFTSPVTGLPVFFQAAGPPRSEPSPSSAVGAAAPPDAADTRRGASLDTHLEAVTFPSSSIQAATPPPERARLKRRMGMRSKFSNTKRKGSASCLGQQQQQQNYSYQNEGPVPGDSRARQMGPAVAVRPTRTSTDTCAEMRGKREATTESEASKSMARGGRFRRKLSKWVRGAKHVVGVCMGKRRGASGTAS